MATALAGQPSSVGYLFSALRLALEADDGFEFVRGVGSLRESPNLMAHQVLAFGYPIETERLDIGRTAGDDYALNVSFSIEWCYELPADPADQETDMLVALLWAATIPNAVSKGNASTGQYHFKLRTFFEGETIDKQGRFLLGEQRYRTNCTVINVS